MRVILGLFGSFPRLGVPFLGVPIVRTMVYWGLGSPPQTLNPEGA